MAMGYGIHYAVIEYSFFELDNVSFAHKNQLLSEIEEIVLKYPLSYFLLCSPNTYNTPPGESRELFAQGRFPDLRSGGF
ncbi:MAG: hypothetical protein IKX47_06160 [Oscillospiraceae bacterium]|nr:hypothetical protein [Oscillospiraceae bacterium]